MMVFTDRRQAGKELARALAAMHPESPVVLGLPRGGVVVAAEVARALDAPLDVLVPRKVGAPGHPEFGIGAVGPGNIQVADAASLARLGVSEEEFERLAGKEREEVSRRLRLFRGNEVPPDLIGRTAIIVDDGLATGVTALAAVRYARSLQPENVILAVPVCSQPAHAALQPEVDELVCLLQPEQFYAVGQFYDDFTQVEDQEVVKLLKEVGDERKLPANPNR